MKKTLCVLALVTLAILVDALPTGPEEPISRRASAATDCGRNFRNLFLITCAKEHQQDLLTQAGRRSILTKLGSLVEECCTKVCSPDVVSRYC